MVNQEKGIMEDLKTDCLRRKFYWVRNRQLGLILEVNADLFL